MKPTNTRRALALALALLLAPAAARAQQPVLFRNARVFDGSGVHTATDVLVRDGRIATVGRNLQAPGDARIVDASGHTLLPGLIDAHTHSWGDALREAAVFGVTTNIDMFTDAATLRETLAAQRADGAPDRADLVSAGVLVTAPGGHGTEYGIPIPTLTRPDSAQAFVDARLAEGSHFIKIVYDDGALFKLGWPTLSKETMKAVIDAAHLRGKLAVVHVTTAAAARDAIEAGADGLVHLFVDTPPPADFAQLVAARGAFVIPTLVVLRSITGVGGGAPLVEDSRLLPYLTPRARALLVQGFGNRPGTPAKDYAFAEATVRQLAAAGVPVLAGTDAPNPGTSHGAAQHRELELLVAAGLTPIEALRAATSLPARIFDLRDRGRIAPGLRADLLLVRGDPTADITATRAIAGVWKAGHAIDRAAFAREAAAALAAENTAPAGLDAGVVADFERGEPAAAFGSAFIVSTDQMMGGASSGQLNVVDGGANGTAKSLSIAGEIVAKSQYVWSGAMWSPNAVPMTPADLSSKRELRFWARGDGGIYLVMVFAQQVGMAPVVREFAASAEWQEVVMPWSDFRLDGKGIMAILFSGGPEPGRFSFQIDEVSLR